MGASVHLGNAIVTCDCVCNSLYDLKGEKKKNLIPTLIDTKSRTCECVFPSSCVMLWCHDQLMMMMITMVDNNVISAVGTCVSLDSFLLLSQLCPAVSGVWVLICLLKKSEVNLLSYSEHWAPLSSSFIFAARAALLAGVQVGFLFFSKVKAYGPMVCIQKTFIPYAKCFNSNICVWSAVETPAYLHE